MSSKELFKKLKRLFRWLKDSPTSFFSIYFLVGFSTFLVFLVFLLVFCGLYLYIYIYPGLAFSFFKVRCGLLVLML